MCAYDKENAIIFSIIVPVYNAEKYLGKCIQSVLEQTFPYFELILVNDGSNDHSAAICEQYAAENSRAKVFHQENQGQTSARKKGVYNSIGEYVLFLDSDDWMEQDTLEKCFDVLHPYEPDLVVFGNKRITEKCISEESVHFVPGFYTSDRMQQHIYPCLLMNEEGNFFPRALWGKAFKRHLLWEHLNLVPEIIRNGEDMCCIISLVLDCSSIYVLDENLYCYRADVAGSVSKNGDKLALARCKTMVSFLNSVIQNKKWQDTAQYNRLLVQQIYSASLRTSDAVGIGKEFKQAFKDLMCEAACRTAVKQAVFAVHAKKLRIKQLILRFRLFGIMRILRKAGS